MSDNLTILAMLPENINVTKIEGGNQYLATGSDVNDTPVETISIVTTEEINLSNIENEIANELQAAHRLANAQEYLAIYEEINRQIKALNP